MLEDQKIELLPARTTMRNGGGGGSIFVNQSFNEATAVAANVNNFNVGGDQLNVAAAVGPDGSNGFLGG